ncbi:hypothetical protein FRC08_017130 [Ceratobasidium sp. 394]|nr:hypothetical protein FRC08_017130 [Ceratobasidium sp. 394]
MFSTLTYPVEQPYRLRWITEMFYAGSVVLVALLVVFNVALVGYDTVTIMISDPNVTDYEQWWAPKSLPNALKFRTKPGECDEAKLPLNTPLRTNSSLPFFPYVLQNSFNQYGSQLDSHNLRRETPYKANPLDTCRVQTMALTMEPKILSFVVTTTILCDPTGDPPRARLFQTSFKRADSPRFRPDSILEYMAYMASPNETDSNVYKMISRDGPPKDTHLNVLGVIDALASDLIGTMFMRKVTWFHINSTTNQSPVPDLGSMEWDSRLDDRTPTDDSRLKSWKTYTDGVWYQGNYVRAINATIINMFVAIRDAVHLDVGYVTPTNIYANKTAFNNMITIDKYRSNLTPLMYEYFADDVESSTTCSWGWGCAPNFNTSWAQALTSTNNPVNNITLPISLPSPLPPSVIDMVYLCPQYRLKSWGSLVIDVFTGTFSMYVTLYGIFLWVGPALDRKRHGPQPWERFMSSRSALPEYERRVKSTASRAPSYSSMLYTPEFEDDQKRLLDEDLEKKGV